MVLNVEIVCVTTCSHCYKVTKHNIVIRPQLYKLMCDCFPLANGAITNVQLHLLPTPYPSNCLVIALEVHPLLAIRQEMVLTSPTTAHSASPFHLLDHMMMLDIELPTTGAH